MVARLTTFLRGLGRVPLLFIAVALLGTTVPFWEAKLTVGPHWQGVLPTYSDELNFARVLNIARGHVSSGNAYFMEHSDGPPLVLFGGAWLNAIPFLAGAPYEVGLYINFAFWSILFALTLYWLLRELSVHRPAFLFLGGAFLYLHSYQHLWRPINLQPVFPFFFLFYIALLRFLKAQTPLNTVFLGSVAALSFYLFAFLWQIVVTTLGLLFLYACVQRAWKLARSVLAASLIGALGFPVPLYMYLLSKASPYYWESMGRLGLTYTHIPTSEIFYSGGWVVIMLGFIGLLLWKNVELREDASFKRTSFFLYVSGIALLIVQASNVITGVWLETGEHVRIFIIPWLMFAGISVGSYVWSNRAGLSSSLRVVSVVVFTFVFIASINFTNQTLRGFLYPASQAELWKEIQLYSGVFAWLNQKNPSVVWVDPHDYLSTVLPVYTPHFTLYAYWGMLELVPEKEIAERYLVSQYFANPTFEFLRTDREMNTYLGRHDFPHAAKTIEREIKVCKLLFFWKSDTCGEIPTPQSLKGDDFFLHMERTFTSEIKPHIRELLKKYHVEYIVKDKDRNPQYHPEVLGARRVYEDRRFEIYAL